MLHSWSSDKMDPLSQAIGLLRPKALLLKTVQGTGEWALRFPEENDVVFGQVSAGRCQLELKGLEPRQLCMGDFLLLTAPGTWVLRNGDKALPLDFESVYEGPAQSLTLVGSPDGVNVTRFLAGHFTFDAANVELLPGLMPSVIHIRPSDKAAGRLCGLLELIGDEATSSRPGQSLVLGRLLDVMLIESLRYQPGHVGESGEVCSPDSPTRRSPWRCATCTATLATAGRSPSWRSGLACPVRCSWSGSLRP